MQAKKSKIINPLLCVSGMTLLEVIIAMAIFGMVAFSLMRMTDVSVRYRSKLEDRVKQTRLTRSVIQVLRKDLRNMFFVDDMNAGLVLSYFKSQGWNTSQRDGPTRSQNRSLFLNWTSPEPLGIGGLIGNETNLKIMSFSTAQEEKSFKELRGYQIMYHVKTCSKQEGDCLWRYVLSDFSDLSNLLDTDLKDSTHSGRILLRNVKTFQLAYLNIFDNQWQPEWPMESQERPLLPAAVKIVLEFQDARKKQVKESLIVPIYQRYLSLRMMNE